MIALRRPGFLGSPARAPPPASNNEGSKETENPVSRQISLPLLFQADFLDGADHLTKSTFEVDQAIVPFRLNDEWSLITRTKLPAEALPATNAMLGATKFGSGPSIAFIREDAGPWVYGLVANNIWTFGGATGGNASNQMLLNP